MKGAGEMRADLYNPTEDHLSLRENVSAFAKENLDSQAKDHDDEEKFNKDLFRRLGSELGIFGVTVPQEEGGMGLDPVASVIIHEEFSAYDPGFTLSYLAHEVLFVNNFFHSGNSSQRAKYMPKVLSGEWIGGMGMTEPGAGTDVLGMSTVAVKRGDRYVLNGIKQFITNGNVGQVFLIYAKTHKDSRRTTSFIVESSYPGFSVGKKRGEDGDEILSYHPVSIRECGSAGRKPYRAGRRGPHAYDAKPGDRKSDSGRSILGDR